MRIHRTRIPGLVRIVLPVFGDARGTFVKILRRDLFDESGLKTQFAEEYYTISRPGVLRGLHFQIPPMQHAKLVCCLLGEVLDAVVDLRVGSPTYGEFETFPLKGETPSMLYIPAGLAHGFCVDGREALMLYKVTSAYSPQHDTGILWNSAGIPWPVRAPVVSERDSRFSPLSEFKSPFFYRERNGDG